MRARGNDGVVNDGARLDSDAIEDHCAVQAAARPNHGTAAHGRAGQQQYATGDTRGLIHDRLTRAPHQQRRMRDTAHQVGGAADEIIRAAHVTPIGVIHVAYHQAARLQQLREGFALHGDHAASRNRLDDILLEHVATGVDLVRRRILGLFQEGRYSALGIGRNAAKGTGISNVKQVHRHVGVLGMMRIEDAVEIHAGQNVAVEHHDRVLAQLVIDVADTAAGTQRGLLHHVLNFQAQIGAIPEVLLKDLRLIRSGEHHVLNPGFLDTGEQVLEEWVVGRGQHRLRRANRQRAQAGAATSHQNDGIGRRSPLGR